MANVRRLFIVCLTFFLTGCGPSPHQESVRSWMKHNGKLKVLSTIAMIEDLVARIGGEQVDPHTLIKGELDPHSYQLVKGDGEKLQFADVIFYNGLGLEHGPGLQSYLSKSGKAVPLGDYVLERNPDLILYVKGQRDPHIWMDISLWTKTISRIVDTLSAYDPEHAELYIERGKELAEEMTVRHARLRAEMHTVPAQKRYLITSHDAFNYFARAYLASEEELSEEQWGARFEAPEGLAPESQLSVKNIQDIIDHAEKYDIHVLFPESNVSRDSLRKIVSAAGEKGRDLRISDTSLYGDAMGPAGSDGGSYLGMIEHNVNTLVNQLKEPSK